MSKDIDGYCGTVLVKLLTTDECQQIAGLYADERHFRSPIQMARYGFGKGEYRYFTYPLPALLGGAASGLYRQFADIAK